MPIFYDTIDNMVEKSVIYNSNLSASSNPFNNSQSFNLSSTQETPPLSKNYKTPAVTTSSKNKKKTKQTINMLNDIVYKKVDECMQPFVEKINFLMTNLIYKQR